MLNAGQRDRNIVPRPLPSRQLWGWPILEGAISGYFGKMALGEFSLRRLLFENLACFLAIGNP